LEENRRKNNILMFGPKEKVNDSRTDNVTGRPAEWSINSEILSSSHADWYNNRILENMTPKRKEQDKYPYRTTGFFCKFGISV
jgi:hypothetical protein